MPPILSFRWFLLNCLYELKSLYIPSIHHIRSWFADCVTGEALLMTKPVLDDAIGGVYKSLHPVKMVVADLGCSSGPNTFVVMSEVLDVVSDLRRSLQERQEPPEIQFFLNDLPGNDFNHVFRCLGEYKRKVEQEKGNLLVPYYVVGVPGSFYGRLFPRRSVHFFHCSGSLNWLSQVDLLLNGSIQSSRYCCLIAHSSYPETSGSSRTRHRTGCLTQQQEHLHYRDKPTGGCESISTAIPKRPFRISQVSACRTLLRRQTGDFIWRQEK